MLLFIIILILVFITQSILSSIWWIIAVDCFLATLFLGKNAWSSFFAGFLGVGLVWFGQIYYLNSRNEGLLLGKVAKLLTIPSPIWLIVITVLVGALVGGFSALSAYSLKSFWIIKEEQKR